MDMNILDWTEAYLKYKNMATRKIETFEKNTNDNTITCKNKDKTTTSYLCMETLQELKAGEIKTQNLSCLNTKENFNWLIKNWQEVKDTNTTIFFANPKKAMHWSIKPATHDGVADKTALKTGLKALFDSIPEV